MPSLSPHQSNARSILNIILPYACTPKRIKNIFRLYSEDHVDVHVSLYVSSMPPYACISVNLLERG